LTHQTLETHRLPSPPASEIRYPPKSDPLPLAHALDPQTGLGASLVLREIPRGLQGRLDALFEVLRDLMMALMASLQSGRSDRLASTGTQAMVVSQVAA